MTEQMAMIQLGFENNGKVTNELGERIELPKKYDYRTDDCIKCYLRNSNVFYWSSAEIQKEIKVNNMPFYEWLNTLPIKV